jgi:hypothetical protein
MKIFIQTSSALIAVLSALILLCSPAAPAAAADGVDITNTHYIVLTPGHSKTISYDLNWGQVHTTVVHMLGIVNNTAETITPTFSFSAAVTDSVGEGADVVFATTGFVGLLNHLLFAPGEDLPEKLSRSFFANYSYSSDAMSSEREIPIITFSGAGGSTGIIAAQAVLFTGFVLPIGDPDFPITMSMRFELNK